MKSESVINYLVALFSKNQEMQLRYLIDKVKVKKICETLFKTGHTVELNDDVLKLREKVGLSRIPPTVMSSKVELDRFQRLVKKTRLYHNDLK
ncbi:hypothetical protein [[Eubacterium] cellulosolvens]